MSGPSVLLERHDYTAVMTINRPDVANSIDAETGTLLGELLDQLDADPEVRVIVLTGAGDRSFCAGGDLKAMARGERVISEAHRRTWGFAGYVRHVVNKPTIAAVNGAAVGGGMEIVLASDLAIAAEHASFSLPDVTRGFVAGAGGVVRLPRQIPEKRALEMILTGMTIDAPTAERWGLVNRVVPAAELLEATLALATRIAANAPLAVQASKRIAYQLIGGRSQAELTAWAVNDEETTSIWESADSKEGPRAFAEGRPPRWQGR